MHRQDAPIVAVYNYLETFFPFLSRTDDPQLLHQRRYRGDRALFWLGADKLVFVTSPVCHAAEFCQRWGYDGTQTLAPSQPTHQLSLDILREPHLIERLIAYAGTGRTVQLIPYATTAEFLQLARTLSTQHGLTVLLPESPAPERLWLRDYIDSKVGFRVLASRWLPDPALLPFGTVHQGLRQAAGAAHWFNARGQTCVIKPDQGVGGIGHVRVSPQDAASAQDILERLGRNPYLGDDPVVVERYIDAPARLSPSLECFVPRPGAGEPQITYLSNQLFKSGHFAGVLISRELLNAPWYPALREGGLTIAACLQEMGYVGHFDLDTIVDDAGRVYLLEVNARRTAGTFAHEFARFTFGPNYLDGVAVLSYNKLEAGGLTSADELLATIEDLLYPIQSAGHKLAPGPRGIVITAASALKLGEFGCMFIGPSTQEVLTLQQRLLERLKDG